MKNRDKTKNQLIHEVAELNQRIAELEKLETKHNQAEEALRESEEKYRELINGMIDTAWVIDFNGNFVDVNDAAVKIFGYSREEFLSMGPRDIDSSLPIEEISSLIKGMAADKLQVFETTHTTKDGKTIPVEIKSSLMTYQGKRAILSIARDITKRKKVEETLRRSEETAKRLAQENSIMAEIGRIVSSTLDIEAIHERFAEEVKKLIPFDRIAINTINYEDETVTIAYVTGIDVTDRLKGTAIPLVGTLAGEVVLSRKSMVIQAEDPKEGNR